MRRADQSLGSARASRAGDRALAIANFLWFNGKDRFGEAPKPARVPRGAPRIRGRCRWTFAALFVSINAMKTLITTLAVLTLSLTSVVAKDATFISVIIPDGGDQVQLDLKIHQWIKITNFTQNSVDMQPLPNKAGVAVFKGENGLWVLFARDVGTPDPHEDVFVAGPATVIIVPPGKEDAPHAHAIVFLTYERGSD
jgi:hypothetical protein